MSNNNLPKVTPKKIDERVVGVTYEFKDTTIVSDLAMIRVIGAVYTLVIMGNHSNL